MLTYNQRIYWYFMVIWTDWYALGSSYSAHRDPDPRSLGATGCPDGTSPLCSHHGRRVLAAIFLFSSQQLTLYGNIFFVECIRHCEPLTFTAPAADRLSLNVLSNNNERRYIIMVICLLHVWDGPELKWNKDFWCLATVVQFVGYLTLFTRMHDVCKRHQND